MLLGLLDFISYLRVLLNLQVQFLKTFAKSQDPMYAVLGAHQ